MAYSKVNRTSSGTQLKELDEMTKCCICTQTFDSPKLLPCSHTFCLKCLKSCAADKKTGDKLSCPICRQEYKIPVEGVKGFQTNIFAEKLAELARTPDWASKEAKCDVCLEHPDNLYSIPVAESHCVECQQNICKDCAHHHRRNKVTSNHKLIDLEGLNESVLVTITSKACEKHPKNPLVVYCLHCSVPVCQLCFQESHSGHKSENVNKRAETVRKQLEVDVTKITCLHDEIDNVLNKELPKSLLDIITETEVKIHERSKEIKGIVDHHEKRLLEYLNIVKKKKQKESLADKTETEIYISEMASFLMMARELQGLGSISDLSSTGTMLMARAKELQAKYDNIHKKLKAHVALPVTELVPIDFDQLLAYSTGNLIGKIKVNCVEKGLGTDDDYYTFVAQYRDNEDDDDLYNDCVYIPELDSSGIYDSVSIYEPRYPLDRSTPQPPTLKPRARPSSTSSDYLLPSAGKSTLTEIQPSAVVLHDKLCRGKYTNIWRGKLNHTTDVSVKTFTHDAMQEQWIVNSCDFFREAEILQKLSHPNIVKLIGVSTLSEPFYVITEFTSKGFLDKYLKSEKERGHVMQLKEVVNMAAQIADAMYFMETNKYIHRFLAAKSILVVENCSLKIANFEMAILLKSRIQGRLATHTDVYELIGSPIKTRAPEVIESQRWSIKSDVWSFAIIIYEILTYSANPYPGLSDSELMNRILTTYEFHYPVGPNFKYPDPKLRSLMESCWKKDPNERPDFKYLLESFRDFFKNQDFMGYMRRPKIIKALKIKGPVSGITTYGDEIFIIRSDSTTIDVFNSSTFKRTNPILTTGNKKFQILRKRKQTQNYNGLQDITSCTKKGFIYVCSWQDCIIHRIKYALRSLFGSWEVKNGDPTTLAVTQNGNLLVSCASEGKVLEYTFDGNLVHEITFGCNGEGPLHTVQMANERFVVCHGRRQAVGTNEGVTIIDKHGNAVTESKPLALSQPCHLATDSNNNVLIAAKGRSKLTVWNPIKDLQRVLISLDQEMKVPTRIHLNESTGQLLMLFRNSTLMIYQVKSTESKVATSDYDDYCPYSLPPPRPRPAPPSEFSSRGIYESTGNYAGMKVYDTRDLDQDLYEELQ